MPIIAKASGTRFKKWGSSLEGVLQVRKVTKANFLCIRTFGANKAKARLTEMAGRKAKK